MARPARRFARRADILAERLSYPRERILAWGFTQAVLSAAWHVEDDSDRFGPPLRALKFWRRCSRRPVQSGRMLRASLAALLG